MIEPFRIAVPEAQLDDLRDRLRRTRWPQQIGDNAQWQAGTELSFIQALVDHWLHSYDWRQHEAAMNAFPQFRTAQCCAIEDGKPTFTARADLDRVQAYFVD